jgi:DNA-binding IclR family transcriptional regulator
MRRPVVKSASRTLEVLELFSEQRRPLRLHEIYEQLHYPQSSATNLMKSMVMMGYLNYNRATRTYIPTNKVGSLGNWLSSFMYGQSGYHELVNSLQKRTDETVALSTQNDLFIQYMIIKTPQHEFKMPPGEGSMRLLTKSTSGMALLSRMSNRQVDKICRHINYYELGPENRVEITQVLKDLVWIRQIGYSYTENYPTPEVSSMAFPLGESLYGIPLALGVGGLSDRIARRKMQIVATIRETIAEFKEKYADRCVSEFTGALMPCGPTAASSAPEAPPPLSVAAQMPSAADSNGEQSPVC